MISSPPWTTWVLVTTMPSARTMAPEPSDWATRDCGTPEPPNISQNGSTRWRTVRRAKTLTTAGEAFLTTGAKESRIEPASVGARRVVGSANPSPWKSWAAGWPGLPEQAARKTTRARDRVRARMEILERLGEL